LEQVASTLLIVIVVVPVDDRFVLIEEAKESCRGKWSLPGGLVEKGENVMAAAAREAREEAGLDVAPRGILAIEQIEYGPGDERPYTQKFRVVVVADAVSGELKATADQESLRARLCTRAEIDRLALRELRYAEWIDAYRAGNALLPFTSYGFRRMD
jgi:8-oxo-dGDP phosphatase